MKKLHLYRNPMLSNSSFVATTAMGQTVSSISRTLRHRA